MLLALVRGPDPVYLHVVLGARVGRLRLTNWALSGPGWRWERGPSGLA